MKTLGIVAHSAEGAALCFLTACREGQKLLGPHMHPEIVLSAIPMALSLPAWKSNDHARVAPFLRRGVEQVAAAGADFFICPANTAHIVLEEIARTLPIPGLHIAEVVAQEMAEHGWSKAGLLATEWTMRSTVYADALRRRGFSHIVPDAATRSLLDRAIFAELCLGVFTPETTALFEQTIEDLRSRGADSVILGCTEIPLMISDANSALPVLDSTRLLAKYAVMEAADDRPLVSANGWLHAPADTPTPARP
ncbi:MAG TPA: amino acid racemase [Longimicrobiales bacterium]